MLKKNCLYIGSEKEYSKKINYWVDLDYRLYHKLIFGPLGTYISRCQIDTSREYFPKGQYSFLLQDIVCKERKQGRNAHRFALSALRGELLEREIERKKERERDSFGILYILFGLSFIQSKD